MGSYLADTNLLLRLADPNSEQHAVATQALARLLGQGNEVYLTPQNFIEFWAVATRPVEGNGFGWTSERTAKEVADLQERFPILPDSPEVFARWLDLVQRFPVRGISEFTTPAWSPCFRLMLLSTWFRSILRTSPRSHSFH